MVTEATGQGAWAELVPPRAPVEAVGTPATAGTVGMAGLAATLTLSLATLVTAGTVAPGVVQQTVPPEPKGVAAWAAAAETAATGLQAAPTSVTAMSKAPATAAAPAPVVAAATGTPRAPTAPPG